MATTSEKLVKKYEELSGRPGEFETKEATDSNGADTIQVWNKVSGSLVAEVLKGSEQELLDDPQVVPFVERRSDVAEPVEYKDGREVKPRNESKTSETTEKTAPRKKAAAKTPADKKGADTAKTAEKQVEAGQNKTTSDPAKVDSDKAGATVTNPSTPSGQGA